MQWLKEAVQILFQWPEDAEEVNELRERSAKHETLGVVLASLAGFLLSVLKYTYEHLRHLQHEEMERRANHIRSQRLRSRIAFTCLHALRVCATRPTARQAAKHVLLHITGTSSDVCELWETILALAMLMTDTAYDTCTQIACLRGAAELSAPASTKAHTRHKSAECEDVNLSLDDLEKIERQANQWMQALSTLMQGNDEHFQMEPRASRESRALFRTWEGVFNLTEPVDRILGKQQVCARDATETC
jgi:hypothetical protein